MSTRESLSPDSLPFDSAMERYKAQGNLKRFEALNEAAQILDLSKRMLIQQRVKDFTANDVVELSKLVMELESRKAGAA